MAQKHENRQTIGEGTSDVKVVELKCSESSSWVLLRLSFFDSGEKLQGEVAFFYIFRTQKCLLCTKWVQRKTILGALQQRCRSGKRAQTTAY